jgi:hypothetical protein
MLATIPAPGGGGDSGLAWAEGTLWVGRYRYRKTRQIDIPDYGRLFVSSSRTALSPGHIGQWRVLAAHLEGRQERTKADLGP